MRPLSWPNTPFIEKYKVLEEEYNGRNFWNDAYSLEIDDEELSDL